MGTYVVVESESPTTRAQCFVEYNCCRTRAASYAALYRPTHMIGLELGISVASAALRKEPTGAPICFNSDVVATAKRALKTGEMLDGEGGFCVWGKQTPADVSLEEGYLPLGLAHGVKLKRDIAEGQPLRWSRCGVRPTATSRCASAARWRRCSRGRTRRNSAQGRISPAARSAFAMTACTSMGRRGRSSASSASGFGSGSPGRRMSSRDGVNAPAGSAVAAATWCSALSREAAPAPARPKNFAMW